MTSTKTSLVLEPEDRNIKNLKDKCVNYLCVHVATNILTEFHDGISDVKANINIADTASISCLTLIAALVANLDNTRAQYEKTKKKKSLPYLQRKLNV